MVQEQGDNHGGLGSDGIVALCEPEIDTLHLLTTLDDECVLFDPVSLRIFSGATNTSSREAEWSDSLTDGISPVTVNSTAAMPTGDSLRDLAPIPSVESIPESTTGGRPRLSRLTLHIANTCNLSCSYCYASGGHYTLPEALMSGSRAADLIGEALRLWDVETLMFFGGEPSLNPDAIAEVCLLTTELHRRGLLAVLPRFGVISNLAGHGESFDEFLGLCKLLDIHITVSVDGPAEVHDANRHDRSGCGSYTRVRDNFQRARDLGLDPAVECTYTREHRARGITILDLMHFFHQEFGLRQTHIVPMLGSSGRDDPTEMAVLIEQYCEAIRYTAMTQGTDAMLSVSLGQRLLTALASLEPIAHYCPAGHSELAIGPDGLVYPCFMLVGDARFQMGAMDASLWPHPEVSRVLTEIKHNDKASHPLCSSCWARGLCSGCLGGDYYETGDLATKPRCALTKSMAAEAIVRTAEIGLGRPLGYYGNGHRLDYLSACI